MAYTTASEWCTATTRRQRQEAAEEVPVQARSTRAQGPAGLRETFRCTKNYPTLATKRVRTSAIMPQTPLSTTFLRAPHYANHETRPLSASRPGTPSHDGTQWLLYGSVIPHRLPWGLRVDAKDTTRAFGLLRGADGPCQRSADRCKTPRPESVSTRF